jgi:hypothetical protein
MPDRPVVVELHLPHQCDRRYWLVLERANRPYGCLTDPLLEATRYLYRSRRPAGNADAATKHDV